ncbi:MAG TPA: ATP-binding protein [Planctomycetota bacterium]|nr:ATP-binding protein [Planctomycetota bacterium]
MSKISRPDGTLAMSVDNTGFLLDRLGEDCHPLQFLRELTQNAIEAIQKNGGKGDIVWDVDWDLHALTQPTPVYKLCVMDNGCGMSGDEMVRYINRLSSSSGNQSIDQNFGVGAKIAAATRNHVGVVYLSWKAGQGEMVHLWRNPESGTYGLKQLQTKNGGFVHFRSVDDALKPDLIKQSGTKITLFGNDENANTMEAPEGTPSPSRWISKYLNSRYYRFPEGITVKAREGWQNPREDVDRNVLRTLHGQEHYLKAHCRASGVAKLESARVHWWILKDEPAMKNNSGSIDSSGHVAALYQNELYEKTTGRQGTARLQSFGLIFGSNYVVLYVEPETKKQKIAPNTARTHLLIENNVLPWEEWAEEFREAMPKELKDFVDEAAAGAVGSDHTQTIKDRLKDLLDLYKVSKYRAAPDGQVLVDPASVTAGGGASGKGTGGAGGGSGKSQTAGGKLGEIYLEFEKADGVRGDRITPDPFPDVRWVSLADNTRAPGDIEDRAAKFIQNQNTLLINRDFRAFTDLVERFVTAYSGDQSVRGVVEEAVRGWFEQALIETVIGVQALKNQKLWSVSDIEKALSEEGLTAAVMQRYHVNIAVKRELGSKLGRRGSEST